jgi:hypothetical protein
MGVHGGNKRRGRNIILKSPFPFPLFLYLIFTFSK